MESTSVVEMTQFYDCILVVSSVTLNDAIGNKMSMQDYFIVRIMCNSIMTISKCSNPWTMQVIFKMDANGVLKSGSHTCCFISGWMKMIYPCIPIPLSE